MRRLERALLKLLFPPKCVFCQRVVDDDQVLLCTQCLQVLPLCDRVRTFPSVVACHAPLYYEDNVREAILRYKFQDASHYSATFGTLVGQMLADRRLIAQFDVLSWVPVSRKRLRARGYDQAKLLAQGVGAYLERPVSRTLEKVRNNPPQSGLENAADRRTNVQGVYAPVETETWAGKRILLIDDVVTTGSTLSECAGILLEAGAAQVLCAALAMTRSRDAGDSSLPEMQAGEDGQGSDSHS